MTIVRHYSSVITPPYTARCQSDRVQRSARGRVHNQDRWEVGEAAVAASDKDCSPGQITVTAMASRVAPRCDLNVGTARTEMR